jgi:hypothetical protein
MQFHPCLVPGKGRRSTPERVRPQFPDRQLLFSGWTQVGRGAAAAAALSVVLMGICCMVISLAEIATRGTRPTMTARLAK